VLPTDSVFVVGQTLDPATDRPGAPRCGLWKKLCWSRCAGSI